MLYGLDIGADAVRLARDAPAGPVVATAPPTLLPIDDAALESRSLALEGVSSLECGGTTYALGSDAVAIAEAVDEPTESLLSDGLLAADERTVPALRSLVGELFEELDSDGEGRLCYTVPGPSVPTDGAAAAHRERLAEVLSAPSDGERDLEATPVNAGFAVVYDQLAEDNYTGLGVALEAHATTVSLSYYGVPVLAFSLAKGREWLIERAADETNREPSEVAAVFEAFRLDPDAATGDVEGALAQAFDALAVELVDAIRERAADANVRRGVAVPVAVGGSAAVDGLEYLLGGRFDAGEQPISVRGVRLAEDPAASPVRGALAAARDGVDADEAVPVPATEATELGETLSFSERAVDGADGRPAAGVAGLEALSASADSLAATDVRLKDDVATHELEIAALSAAVDEVADDLESVVETDVADLEDRLEGVRTHLEGVDGRLEEQSIRIGGVAGRLEELSAHAAARLDETDGAIADVQASLTESVEGSGEEERPPELTAAVETLETDVTALATDLRALERGLESATDRTAALEGRFDSTAARVEALETTLEATAEATAATEAELGAIETRLVPLESERDGGDAAAAVADLRAELDDSRAELEAIRDDSGAGPLAPALAGGGAGAIATGGALVVGANGPIAVATAVAGVCLLGAAFALAAR